MRTAERVLTYHYAGAWVSEETIADADGTRTTVTERDAGGKILRETLGIAAAGPLAQTVQISQSWRHDAHGRGGGQDANRQHRPHAGTQFSTGGDRGMINTLYMGGPSGWVRIGAVMPQDKPDEFGSGNAFAEQWRFSYGEEPSVIYDAAGKANYVIAALYNRHVRRSSQPGYGFFDWDASKKTLKRPRRHADDSSPSLS
ncbi:MAG TPA: hypothetical protein VF774_17670, partial [Pseudoduganella sp.]